MKQLFVIRHCSATGQSEDAPLTPDGAQQAAQLAEFLKEKGIERIVVSPYVRARKSAEPFSEQSHIPIEVDSRLGERVLSGSHMDNWLQCRPGCLEVCTTPCSTWYSGIGNVMRFK